MSTFYFLRDWHISIVMQICEGIVLYFHKIKNILPDTISVSLKWNHRMRLIKSDNDTNLSEPTDMQFMRIISF